MDAHPPKSLKMNSIFIEDIGLRQNLSPTRSNGLLAMVKKMRLYALAYQAKQPKNLKCQQKNKTKLRTMSESLDFLEIEGKIVDALKKVYDPEIPVNVYDLGLIYEIDYTDKKEANIDMTLTAPNCPVVDILLMDVENAVGALEEVEKVNINLVFDPPWDKSMLSEEAKLELGLL